MTKEVDRERVGRLEWGENGAAGGGALAAGCPGGVGAVVGQKNGWRGSSTV